MAWSAPGSVLDASFGTQATISGFQMMEIAMDSVTSGKAFIWVVRPLSECHKAEEFRAAWLPDGLKSEWRIKTKDYSFTNGKHNKKFYHIRKSIGAFLAIVISILHFKNMFMLGREQAVH